MLAKTLAGLEEVLAGELQRLGARNIRVAKRGVFFEGDAGFMYKANLWLRTALRILVPLRQFDARHEDNIYRQVKDFPWEQHFEPQKTILVKAQAFSPQYKNSLYLAQRVKDGIADRFRQVAGQRPSVHRTQPDVLIDLHEAHGQVTLSLDSSGSSLHRRGYRQEAGRAPLSEVLAAGILHLAGWDGLRHFVDPMCGSGTFLIEAALLAHHLPPGVFRKSFAFQHWKNFDPQLYQLIHEKSLAKEKNFHFSLRGFDNHSGTLLKARQNIRHALLSDQISVEKADFLQFAPGTPPQRPGLLVCNPPYGEKLQADLPRLYRGIGDSLKTHFAGYTAWIFSASREGLKHIGLKPQQKIALKNGPLDAWLVGYELYEGSKRADVDP